MNKEPQAFLNLNHNIIDGNFRFGFFCLLAAIMLLVPPAIILVSYAQNNTSVKSVKSDRSLGNSEGTAEGQPKPYFRTS
jgi:hypothetical protein